MRLVVLRSGGGWRGVLVGDGDPSSPFPPYNCTCPDNFPTNRRAYTSVARKTSAAASSRKDDCRAVAVKGGGLPSRSFMDGRGDDDDDDEAAVPLPKVS